MIALTVFDVSMIFAERGSLQSLFPKMGISD